MLLVSNMAAAVTPVPPIYNKYLRGLLVPDSVLQHREKFRSKEGSHLAYEILLRLKSLHNKVTKQMSHIERTFSEVLAVILELKQVL